MMTASLAFLIVVVTVTADEVQLVGTLTRRRLQGVIQSLVILVAQRRRSMRAAALAARRHDVLVARRSREVGSVMR